MPLAAMPLESIPASGSHSQPMDTFLFHGNCTSQSHGTAGNHEAGGFVNSAVRSHSHRTLSDSISVSDAKKMGRKFRLGICILPIP